MRLQQNIAKQSTKWLRQKSTLTAQKPEYTINFAHNFQSLQNDFHLMNRQDISV